MTGDCGQLTSGHWRSGNAHDDRSGSAIARASAKLAARQRPFYEPAKPFSSGCSMLAAVRRSVRSWAAGLILFLALVAIVITGFGTGGFGGLGSLSSGPKGDVLASVDGKQLTENEASDILNRQFGRARQEQPELSMSTFLQSAFEPIVDQLI